MKKVLLILLFAVGIPLLVVTPLTITAYRAVAPVVRPLQVLPSLEPIVRVDWAHGAVAAWFAAVGCYYYTALSLWRVSWLWNRRLRPRAWISLAVAAAFLAVGVRFVLVAAHLERSRLESLAELREFPLPHLGTAYLLKPDPDVSILRAYAFFTGLFGLAGVFALGRGGRMGSGPSPERAQVP